LLQPSAGLAVHDALGDQLARAFRGARDEQVDPRPDLRAVRARARDLLADERVEVTVEREEEGLHLPA
jgi:hypothetical protein